MHDIECPYCGEGVEICHDDGQGYEEDRLHEQECEHCDKCFVFTTCIHFSYDAKKADCLNGEPHNYKPTHTYPVEFTRMNCKTCDEHRSCTDEEMAAVVKLRA